VGRRTVFSHERQCGLFDSLEVYFVECHVSRRKVAWQDFGPTPTLQR
jgi:hypothetical protein